jgi:heptosyltransferase III
MKILLIRTGGLGDCVLTLPAACRIKNIYPGAELHVLGNETMLHVARLSGEFDGYTSIDTHGFHRLYSDQEPPEYLRTYFSRFDTVFFYSTGNTELLSRTVLGSGAGACRILDPRPPDFSEKPKRHITKHLLSILPSNESPDESSQCFEKSDRSEAVANKLVIHPGSGSISKNWPVGNFLDIAEKSGMDVTFVLGHAEIERGVDRDIPAEHYTVIRPETIGQLHRILSEAAVYIGNDSGVSHLAAFAGTRSIVLFGPTDPEVWRPLGENVEVLSSPDGAIGSISREDVLAKICG